MIILSYFLLLHLGQYTASKSGSNPLCLCYAALSCGNAVFIHTYNTADLKDATFTILGFPTHKNGA